METRRIYFADIGGSRKRHRMWLELSFQQEHRLYWRSVRRSYRIMRIGGLDGTYARWVIYDMLLLGKTAQRCDEYGLER
jgi:hypothetical protein